MKEVWIVIAALGSVACVEALFASLGEPSRVIGELSPAELSSLCDATVSTFNQALGGKSIGEVGCQRAYLSFALDALEGELSELCELVVAECADSDDTFTCPFTDDNVSECTATVGEFQTCLSALSTQYGKFASLSCSTVTIEELREWL